MEFSLTPTEIRVLGSLMEKELATPDYYPLSLSALTAACNQKTSREPIMSLGEEEVLEALASLTARALARERNPAGSRVNKYAHRLDDSLGLRFGFTREERAVLSVLMLRGPQTPGELRTRSERLRGPGGRDDIEAMLRRLGADERGPWVRELPREGGRREARWMHLFGGDSGPGEPVAAPGEGQRQAEPPPHAPPPDASLRSRLERLERELAALREQVARLAGGRQGPDGES